MLQRIQTVYMFLAAVLSIVCLCLQIGTFSAAGVPVLREFNLWMTDPLGDHHYSTWPLFAVLVLSSAIGLCNIFLFQNRKMQARICQFNMLLVLGWYILFAVFSQTLGNVADMIDLTFRPEIAAALPCVSTILYLMARHAILADEKLVRAADRIR